MCNRPNHVVNGRRGSSANSRSSWQKEQEVARACLARAITRPRFVIADGWAHIFSEDRGDTETRWIFDRHLWRLVTLHVREHFRADWAGALPDEVADVEDSLVDTGATVI